MMTNANFQQSRNRREGWYAGKFRDLPQQDKNWWEVKPRHRRTRYANFPVGL